MDHQQPKETTDRMDHELCLFLLLIAAACFLFSLACMVAQAVYANLAYRTVRILRDRWIANVSFGLDGSKTVNVLSAGPDDFRNAERHVWWTRHYGRTALLFGSCVRLTRRAAYWFFLAALLCF